MNALQLKNLAFKIGNRSSAARLNVNRKGLSWFRSSERKSGLRGPLKDHTEHGRAEHRVSELNYWKTPGSMLLTVYSCCWLYTVVYSCYWLYTVVYSCYWLYTVVYSCCWLYTVVYSCYWLYTVVYSFYWLYTVVYSSCWLYTVVYSFCWLYTVLYSCCWQHCCILMMLTEHCWIVSTRAADCTRLHTRAVNCSPVVLVLFAVHQQRHAVDFSEHQTSQPDCRSRGQNANHPRQCLFHCLIFVSWLQVWISSQHQCCEQ